MGSEKQTWHDLPENEERRQGVRELHEALYKVCNTFFVQNIIVNNTIVNMPPQVDKVTDKFCGPPPSYTCPGCGWSCAHVGKTKSLSGTCKNSSCKTMFYIARP